MAANNKKIYPRVIVTAVIPVVAMAPVTAINCGLNNWLVRHLVNRPPAVPRHKKLLMFALCKLDELVDETQRVFYF